MTKEEERAVQRYPRAGKEYKSEFGTFYFDDPNAAHREGFIIGYKQAEEDLGWHSVKESLPPVGEEVIALCNESHGTTLPIACYMCFAHLVEDKTIFVEYNGWNIPGVKYWMPCPELPEK